jgi:hypothetical protein
MFAIETRSAHRNWTDDPNFLGWGCVENDNRWSSEAEALAACDELADVWGCPRSDMRVVPANA